MKIITEPVPVESLGFGQYFAPLKATSRYSAGQWSPVEYSPEMSIQLGSAAKVLHYAQEIFEGLKAYKQKDQLALFRPHANIKRMTLSAQIMAMPEFPEEMHLEILKDMTRRLSDFVPEKPGALYLRPAMIGTTDSLGVSAADEYEFFVIASPVGAYFKGFSMDKPLAVKIKIEEERSRAAAGGTGAAKTGGNYAASLKAIKKAKVEGYENVLFLDARERTFVEELGGMNFFLVEEGVLKTPPLGDTILAGVTRDSVLKLAKSLSIPCSEEMISAPEMIEKIKTGKITETFACGTAATISAISHLGWKGSPLQVGSGEAGPVANQIYKELSDIHYGTKASPEQGWIVKV
jgi:branched-chain amino acid aminotransferase